MPLLPNAIKSQADDDRYYEWETHSTAALLKLKESTLSDNFDGPSNAQVIFAVRGPQNNSGKLDFIRWACSDVDNRPHSMKALTTGMTLAHISDVIEAMLTCRLSERHVHSQDRSNFRIEFQYQKLTVRELVRVLENLKNSTVPDLLCDAGDVLGRIPNKDWMRHRSRTNLLDFAEKYESRARLLPKEFKTYMTVTREGNPGVTVEICYLDKLDRTGCFRFVELTIDHDVRFKYGELVTRRIETNPISPFNERPDCVGAGDMLAEIGTLTESHELIPFRHVQFPDYDISHRIATNPNNVHALRPVSDMYPALIHVLSMPDKPYVSDDDDDEREGEATNNEDARFPVECARLFVHHPEPRQTARMRADMENAEDDDDENKDLEEMRAPLCLICPDELNITLTSED